MTTIKSIELACDMFNRYRREGYDERSSVEYAVKDMMKVITAQVKSVEGN